MDKKENTAAVNLSSILVRSQDRKTVLPLYVMYIDGASYNSGKRSVSLRFLIFASSGLENSREMGSYKTEEEALDAMDKILEAQLNGEKFIQL